MEGYVKGSCMSMCPQEEIDIREKKGLVHFLEMLYPDVRKTVNLKRTFVKSDPSRMVKCYQRSAAGKNMLQPLQIRPPPVLQTTIHYLLNEVICDERLPFCSIYDFVTDRLRAVRQDIIMQQPPPAECIPLLEPMVRFHAYSAYRLCEAELNEFDPVLNREHLITCLKWLLNMYDQINHMSEDRVEMEALYILVNLGSIDALQRSVDLPNQVRQRTVVDAEKLSRAWNIGNYYRVCKNLENLPGILSVALAAIQLPDIRRYALKVMSWAYSSRNLRYPLSNLKSLLLYNSTEEAAADCQAHGIKVEDEKCIVFLKGTFQPSQIRASVKKVHCIDKKISALPLPELLLAFSG